MDTYKFPANITNCSNNYGPLPVPGKTDSADDPQCTDRQAPADLRRRPADSRLAVCGDHCRAIDLVIEKGRLFETYNVGGHNEKQNIEIVQTIIDVLREELPDTDPRKAKVTYDLITYVADRKGHDRRYAIAPDKIKKELGWEPETMFREGIRKTIAWYFDHMDWMEHITSGDYMKYYEKMYGDRD
jgi:dTDP-glucose 4,6-dehydratase